MSPNALAGNGIDGSGPLNVCPGCRTVMPPGAIVCIDCGYNQKLGRKIVTEVVRVGTPAMDAFPGTRPGKPEGSERALSFVATGMEVLWWATLVDCAARVLITLVWVLTPGWSRSPTLRLTAPLAPAGLVGAPFYIVGLACCLCVPRQSRAKGLVLASVAVELAGMLIGYAPLFRAKPPGSDPSAIAFVDPLSRLSRNANEAKKFFRPITGEQRSAGLTLRSW